MARENIRQLTEREQQLLAPDVGGYLRARKALQEARQAKQELWERINRSAQLLCPDVEDVHLDIETMTLYRQVPEGAGDRGSSSPA